MEDDSNTQHDIKDCPRTEAGAFARAIRAMERGLREVGAFSQPGVCPTCGVPRGLDADLVGHREGLGEEGVSTKGS